MDQIKVAIVGTGDRGTSFVNVIQEQIPELKIVAVADTNPIRLENVAKHHNYPSCERFTSVDELLDSRIADLIFITTPDWTHADLLIKCIEKNYHVFCDKPLAIDEKQIKKILDATGKTSRMTFMGFNMRYNPVYIKMHQLVKDGVIGNILSGVAYSGYEGTGYFRRWHKFREKSGGLIVHKGCHTIDILNWCIDSYPVKVYAEGKQSRFGGNKKWEGCHKCEETASCLYRRQLSEKESKLLEDIYIKAAAVDGYTRNYCVFGPSSCPDHYILTIEYANGVLASFTEIFFGTGVSFMCFAGDRGELTVSSLTGSSITVIDKFKKEKKVHEVKKETSRFHGGADILMMKDIVKSLKTGKQILPGFEEGAKSAIIGVAAMKSIDEKRPVKIDELIPAEMLMKKEA